MERNTHCAVLDKDYQKQLEKVVLEQIPTVNTYIEEPLPEGVTHPQLLEVWQASHNIRRLME